MGLKEGWKGLTGGRNDLTSGCEFDRATGEFICDAKKNFSDGSQETVGLLQGGVDANCDIRIDKAEEKEDGVLQMLDNKFVKKMVGKCKATRPSDY